MNTRSSAHQNSLPGLKAFVAAALAIYFSSASLILADEPDAPAPKPATSLDDELLNDLGDKPKNNNDANKPDAGKLNTAKNGEIKNDAGKNATSPLDDELLKQLGDTKNGATKIDGEDLGKPAESDDPLTKIARQMREAEQRLARVKADNQTLELQKEIVSNLDALIKQAQQQKKSQSKSSKATPQSQRSKPSQAKNSSSKPSGQAGTQPSDGAARDSSDKLRDQKTEREARPDVADAMKGSWGRLPERAREQMLESATDEFLPKYELLLEKYFKRLGEDESAAP